MEQTHLTKKEVLKILTEFAETIGMDGFWDVSSLEYEVLRQTLRIKKKALETGIYWMLNRQIKRNEKLPWTVNRINKHIAGLKTSGEEKREPGRYYVPGVYAFIDYWKKLND